MENIKNLVKGVRVFYFLSMRCLYPLARKRKVEKPYYVDVFSTDFNDSLAT
jgi:hypothetical protein